jgi:transposase
MGLLLAVVITAASVQDRDAARPLLWNLHRTCRRIRLIWADAVYTGKLTTWAATMKMTLQIVARTNRHAFEVLPRRWVVERTFAWISKHRRTVRDYERLPASHEAMILWAMIARPVHIHPHVAVLVPHRLAGMQAHPDPHRDATGPGVAGQSALRRQAARHRVGSRAEHDIETVPLSAHLVAAAGRDGGTHNGALRRQRVAVPVAQAAQQRG